MPDPDPDFEFTTPTWIGEPIEAPVHQASVELPSGYVDRGLIAYGGMGEVRLAYDEAMGRDVAIKILARHCLRDPDIVQRFEDESTTMARLDHPAIVAVHARGRLQDGRPWYAMRRVRGETLREILAHRDPSWRRLLTYLASIARGVAYAHDQGIVHCDLKPENLLVGPFGEVQVLDWGIAQRVGMPDRRGLGTPSYMAPEQRSGGVVEGGTDVYALGQVLKEISRRCGTEVLSDLAVRTQARQVGSRPSALEFAEVIEASLDGEARRDQALSLLDSAEDVREACEALEARSRELRDQGEGMLRDLASDALPEDKHAAWAAMDEASQCEAQAETERVRWFRMVHAALQTSPDLPEAHAMLAEYHHRRALQATARSDRLAELRHRQMLELHDRGQFTRYLEGRAVLTLLTEPADVEVTLHRYEVRHRRLIPIEVGPLGRTPLNEVDVPSGSLLLTLHPEGQAPLHIPAFVESGESWVTVAPGAATPWVYELPDPETLGDACWMPAGWFISGGDPDAADGIRRRSLFVGDRFVQRFVVTNRQYLEFLDSLWRAGRVDEAWAHAPGVVSDVDSVKHAVRLGPHGFTLEGWHESAPWELDWPVTTIPWTAASAYAAWWSARTGQAWRLPHDQEAEKAARGVDGRYFPWGNHFESAWARVRLSAGAPPVRASVHEHPEDESVYGVRGVAGNVRVWCINPYDAGGPGDGTEVKVRSEYDGELCIVRGGCWVGEARSSRAASRFAGTRDARYTGVGLRLLRG